MSNVVPSGVIVDEVPTLGNNSAGIKFCYTCGKKYEGSWCPECCSSLHTLSPTRIAKYRLCYDFYIETRRAEGHTRHLSFSDYRKRTPFKVMEELLAQHNLL